MRASFKSAPLLAWFVGAHPALGGCASAVEALELQVSCASTGSPDAMELTVLARVRQAEAPPFEEAHIVIATQDRNHTFSVPAGWRQNAATFESTAPVGVTLRATASVGGNIANASCVIAGGLPDGNPAAQSSATGATVSWPEIEGATMYKLAALEFPTGTVLATASATRSPGTLAFEARVDQTIVIDFVAEALASLDEELPSRLPAPRRAHRRVLLTAGSAGGSATAWQLFGPGDFVAGTLQIRYPNLESGERVAVLLSNAGGVDLGTSSAPAAVVEVEGTTASSAEKHGTMRPAAAGPRVLSDPPSYPSRIPAPFARVVEQPQTPAPRPGERRALCVLDRSQTPPTEFKRISATVQHRSARAAFWVDERVQEAFDGVLGADAESFWRDLEEAYEARVLPAVRAHFGAESDVDGDGVMSFLFTDLGPLIDQGLVGGWFDARDVAYAADTTPDCAGTEPARGTNGLDLIYLRDAGSFHALTGIPLQTLVSELYPNLMAHELQHNVNFRRRHLDAQRPPDAKAEQLWLDEALSQLAEDVAGYGLHLPSERARAAAYLATHARFSLTSWDGSYGNYGGSHALLRYLADRFGPALIPRLEEPRSAGKTNLGLATGVPFDLLFAQFATASVFSNEPYSPDALFDYRGASWTPWHALVGPAAYTLVTPAAAAVVDSLRADGWQALATSAGSAQPVTIRVQASAARPFYVVAVRFTGTLP